MRTLGILFNRNMKADGVNVTTIVKHVPGELVRKSLHFLIALVPPLAAIDLPFTLSLLAAGTLFYAFAEASRQMGIPVPVLSDLTYLASRDRDEGAFVLGPVTLGLGAMLALLLYPEPAASVAIYALAFGDGVASLAGKAIGGPKIPRFGAKTFTGSLACLAVVFMTTLGLTGKPMESLVIACTATFLEALPLRNFDNLVIPFGVGLVAAEFLFR